MLFRSDILTYLQKEKSPAVIHRDIKPPNILLEDRRVYLADFGMSCHPGENTFLGGSPGFAAPEQLEANGYITPKVDVYGLGQTLLCLLTGQAPTSPAPMNIADLTTHQHLSPTSLASLQSLPFSSPGYSKAFALFTAMTVTCPDKRPDIDAVKEELSAIHREVVRSAS